MAPIRTRTLEVTIISGEDLSADGRNPATTDMYVVVRTESVKCWSTKMVEQVAESRTSLWNEKLMVEMPCHAKSITLEVKSKTAKGAVRSIGLARIAIWEVLPKQETCSESAVLSYRLRNWEGRRSGVINFSVKPVNKEQEEKGTMVSSCDLKLRDNCGTVIGIPVCWIHPRIVSV
ncbi:hypothetical protein QN277_023646 [Acacia crassicarpa]|uniref:C2 domain-containing protein n=1 Tax=Acacia crassicarpa TaxID=499986 RepID=A0AAE1MIR0_9FABA|nr:hypothetical protein QN277_023646 [Acacia crassicarpa]